VPHSGLFFWLGSLLMSLFVMAFALADSFPVAVLLMALAGLGHAAFSSLQSTILLSSSSDQLRGRAMGALTLAIGSAQVGTLEVGAITVLLGAPAAVALNAAVGAALVLATGLRLPRFRAA
jgi:predicted MFS family arabinose efflux permease